MNIFILDTDQAKAARYHCDKHVVKMILESAQILSTVHRLIGDEVGYKATHIHHPCTRWALESLSNYRWIKRLASCLHTEWKYRFNHPRNKEHKSYQVIAMLGEPDTDDIGLTPFVQAMPESFKHDDPVQAYRAYYQSAKRDLHQWTKRGKPYWIK